MTQVNTRAAHAAAVARMTGLSGSIDTLQGQLTSGKRVVVASDDPVAFSRAAVLRRTEATAAATKRGIDAANRRLGATDAALEAVGNLVQRARELALQGSNGTLAAADRTILATEIGELREQLAGLSESRGSDGDRLFGGAVADRPAYGPGSGGALAWQGGGRAPVLDVGGGTTDSGITGPQAFGVTDPIAGSRDLFATLDSLQAALGNPDTTPRETGMATALDEIDGHVTRLATARATTGARMARLDTEAERIAQGSLAIQGDLTRLESLDMAEGIARLQRLITVLKAAQGSFVATGNLSLWDQLR